MSKKKRVVHCDKYWLRCGYTADKAKSTTKDWSKVTCKLCLASKPEPSGPDPYAHETIAAVLGEDYGYK